MVPVDVLSPICEPSNSVVMCHGFPVARDVGNRDGCRFTNVNGDILRPDAQLPFYVNSGPIELFSRYLESAFLRMISSTSE